ENLQHFTPQLAADGGLLVFIQFIHTHAEQVVVQIEIPQQHLGVKNVFLIDVDVNQLVQIQGFVEEEILDRIDFVINVQLVAVNITGEAAHTVIHCHDIGIELVDQVVQRLQWRDN